MTMKFRVLLLLIKIISITAFAGNDRYGYLNIKRSAIRQYKDSTRFYSYLKLPVEFSSDVVKMSPERKKILSTSSIIKIELYYTKFISEQSFKADSLNYKRLDNLKESFPDLFNDARIQWSFIKQTGATDIKSAKTYFHGFIISYRDTSNIMDICLMLNLINGREPLSEIDELTFDSDTTLGNLKGLERFRTIDTTVIAVFNRHKYWKNSIIICDATGSMSPYYSQLIKWHAINDKRGLSRVKAYILFNDGDNKSDLSKKVGHTGGVYILEKASLRSLAATTLKVIFSGSGGDLWENDFEAIREGVLKFGANNEFIWIADNFSFPRDYGLAQQLKGLKIKIIMCGAEQGLHPDFLKLSYDYHWPIYTIEQDIENLESLRTEEGFKYKGNKYRLIDNFVERVK